MAELKDLENKMRALIAQGKECVDLSFELIHREPETKKVILKHWENFLLHFFEYIKGKEKETGEDIIKGISLRKLIKFR
ncbi:hypothetical protein P8V03_14590 [Clostridium sp. A1-XYC3]|uniref:Uncharacterized protein n=1 Tax=Clostridium tanneri TaxID=3037988 RepID=A0ABU4JW45_9CLOT|nr:hypothetical protein [Clostridium sp. A1-XYC3]MDW8802375.1 hypothetical protein [Clostridium sp. A1-XYC3]